MNAGKRGGGCVRCSSDVVLEISSEPGWGACATVDNFAQMKLESLVAVRGQKRTTPVSLSKPQAKADSFLTLETGDVRK